MNCKCVKNGAILALLVSLFAAPSGVQAQELQQEKQPDASSYANSAALGITDLAVTMAKIIRSAEAEVVKRDAEIRSLKAEVQKLKAASPATPSTAETTPAPDEKK